MIALPAVALLAAVWLAAAPEDVVAAVTCDAIAPKDVTVTGCDDDATNGDYSQSRGCARPLPCYQSDLHCPACRPRLGVDESRFVLGWYDAEEACWVGQYLSP